jgi:hypothetical protein
MPRRPTAVRLLLLLPLLALAPLPALTASRIAVVLSDGQDPGREALRGVREVLPDAEPLGLQDALGALEGVGVVVALGPQAAGLAYPPAVSVVAALVGDAGPRPASGVRVSPLPDAFFLMSKIHDLVPGVSTLAIFTGAGHYQPYVRYLGAAGRVTGTKILLRTADAPADVVTALRSLPGQAQALWLAPEPQLLGQESFRLIAQYCLANKVALIAPVPELAGAGALAGVAPAPHDLGRAAGLAALALAAGKATGSSVDAELSRVLINPATAAALGLKADARDGELLP